MFKYEYNGISVSQILMTTNRLRLFFSHDIPPSPVFRRIFRAPFKSLLESIPIVVTFYTVLLQILIVRISYCSVSLLGLPSEKHAKFH